MRTFFVYTDESGVFDKAHKDIFTFGGMIFSSAKQRDKQLSRYREAEKRMRASLGSKAPGELKATLLSIPDRHKMFRATTIGIRYGTIIYQKRLLDSIFSHKKTKQRYLDFALKRGLKVGFEHLFHAGEVTPDEQSQIILIMDEHSTATNGKYELAESIEEEFARGMHNPTYDKFFPPIMPGLKRVEVRHVDSRDHELVRASDIIANRLLWIGTTQQDYSSSGIHICGLPQRPVSFSPPS